MKFLCLDCDEPMKLLSTEGPDDGSLAVTFRCPECGFRVAMLTNQFETQMVKSLGVKVGGRTTPATPFEQLRTAMANPRADAFENIGAVEQRANAPAGGAVTSAGSAETAMSGGDAESGPGCPFAAMIQQPDAAAASASVAWHPDAEERANRIPSFIRPMAKRAIERYAESKGYATITEAVMDEARGVMGM